MDMVIKAAAVAMVGAVLAMLLKKDGPVTALLVTAAVTFTVLYMAASFWGDIGDMAEILSESAGVTPAAISAVMKTIGIAIVTKIAADICRDASQSAAASSVELLGSAASLYVSLPFIRTVFEMIKDLM